MGSRDNPCVVCGVWERLHPAYPDTEPVQHHSFLSATEEPGLDVGRVVKAISNIAERHGLVKDPPLYTGSLATIYGYSRATPDMDAEIAAEYAALARRGQEVRDG